MTYARDLPRGVNAHISGDAIGVSAGGWGIIQEKQMITKDWCVQTHQNGDQTLRMYAILRGDLQMTPGKSSSQLGHAFKLLTKNIIEDDPQTASEYFSDGVGTNVCLKAKNLNSIERAYQEAISAGLPCDLIIDQGHIMPPHFTGEPIITALGIGPCRRSDIEHITKRFSLVK